MFCARVSDASRNDEENNLSRRGPLHVPSGTYRALPVLPLPLIKERVCGTAKTGGHGHRPVQDGQNGKESIASSQYTRHNVMATPCIFFGRPWSVIPYSDPVAIGSPSAKRLYDDRCLETKKASSLNPCVYPAFQKKDKCRPGLPAS
jgi:hypothetical protein